MASRMQRLNVRLSYLLEDIVAAYTDDGQDYTSVNRDELLNTASRILYDACVSIFDDLLDRVKNRSRGEPDPSIDILKDFVVSKLMTLSNFVDYASTNNSFGIWLDDYPSGNINRVKRPLRVVSTVSGGTTDFRSFKIISQHDIPLVYDNFMPKYYRSKENPVAYVTFNSARSARYLRLFPANLSGSTALFSWLQYPDTDLTSGGADDIQWNSSFDTAILQIASAVALRDDGKMQDYQNILLSTLSELGLNRGVSEDLAKQNLKGKP